MSSGRITYLVENALLNLVLYHKNGTAASNSANATTPFSVRVYTELFTAPFIIQVFSKLSISKSLVFNKCSVPNAKIDLVANVTD